MRDIMRNLEFRTATSQNYDLTDGSVVCSGYVNFNDASKFELCACGFLFAESVETLRKYSGVYAFRFHIHFR
jgi:hypothetical protein